MSVKYYIDDKGNYVGSCSEGDSKRSWTEIASWPSTANVGKREWTDFYFSLLMSDLWKVLQHYPINLTLTTFLVALSTRNIPVINLLAKRVVKDCHLSPEQRAEFNTLAKKFSIPLEQI